MRIAITGTPGTGKTEAAAALARKLGYSLVDLNEFAEKHNLVVGKDEERDSLIVDEKRLADKSENIEDNSIIEGHLAHFCRADLVIVLRTSPRELRQRLDSKGWPSAKIKENLEAERMGVCLGEALDRHGRSKVIEVDTTGRKAEEVADEIVEAVSSNL